MKYCTIVADPPWHYGSWPGLMSMAGPTIYKNPYVNNKRRKAIDYPTLSVEQIAALPVGEMAEKDAHLYLWTTNRYLSQAFGIVAGWGFKYSQLLVWAKTPMGQGPGGTFAQNAEYVLFCRRGSLAHIRRLDSVWFNWPRQSNMQTPGQHSRKPEHFIDLVESVSPGPYVELFSRRHRLGWDVWGDESANTATLGLIPESTAP